MEFLKLLGPYVLYAGDISLVLTTILTVIVAGLHDSFKDPATALRYTTLLGLFVNMFVFIGVGTTGDVIYILKGSYVNDAFAIGGKMALLVCGVCACVFNNVDENIKLSNYMFYPLLKISTIGTFLMLGATSLDVLVLAMGIVSVSTGFMVILSSSDKIYSKTNSVFLITQSIGFIGLVLGTIYIHTIANTVQYSQLKMVMAENMYMHLPILLGLLILISSIGMLMGAVPFANWVAKLHTTTFDSVAVYLRTGVVVACILTLTRLLYGPFSDTATLWKDFVLFIGICGLLVGTMGMLMQENIDRLYGYGSISHVGFLFLALSIGNVNSISAIVVYCISYVLSYVAFLGYGRGVMADGVLVQKLEDLSGAGRSMALHSLAFVIAGLSFAGMPPFIGFFGKVSVLGAVLQWDLPIVVFVLVIAGVLQSIWILRLFRVMYFTSYKIKDENRESCRVVFSNKVQKGVGYVRRITIIVSILFLFLSAPLITLSNKMSGVL